MTRKQKALLDRFDCEYDRLMKKPYPSHLGCTVWAAFERNYRTPEVKRLLDIRRRFRQARRDNFGRFKGGTYAY